MWQEILAVDSKLSHLRSMAQEKDLRPLYIKRRMQLLQGQQQQQQQQQQQSCDGVEEGGGGGPVRNKRYLSLRVKLLKRQFGLPNDVLSLKSLSIGQQQQQQQPSRRHLRPDETEWNVNANEPSSSSSSNRFAFSGVHHIYDQHSSSITRLVFSSSSNFFVCSSMDGSVSVCRLDDSDGNPPGHHFLSSPPGENGGNGSGVLDLDLSESDQFAVSAAVDGTLVLWDVAERKMLRCVQGAEPGAYITFCRFLPRNNNLVVCGVSTGAVAVMNISTGKLETDGCNCNLLGKSLSAELNRSGSLLWVGNDRGHIESFRIDCEHGIKMQKGSRMVAGEQQQPVISLCWRSDLGRLSSRPCLLANRRGSNVLHLFSVADEFGRLEPLMQFGGGGGGGGSQQPLLSSLFLSSSAAAVAGAADGSVLFFDLERQKQRACVNKLCGHSKPVISLGFSRDERFVASADSSGQVIVWKK